VRSVKGVELISSILLLYSVCMAKTLRLDMRISLEDKELFQQAAERDGRSLSNWIIDRLRKVAHQELAAKGKGGRASSGE